MSAHRRVEIVGPIDDDGNVKVVIVSGGGGGGGGDASAANQLVEIASLAAIETYTQGAWVSLADTNGLLTDTQALVTNLLARFPAVAAPSNNVATPSVSKIQAILSGVEPNSGNLYRVDVDTSRRLATTANIPGAATTSNGTSFQIQRTIANFGCTVRAIEAFSLSAGFVVLVDKSTAVANGDFPKGASIFPIAAGGRIEKEWFRGKGFTNGCVMALCTSVSPTITLSASPDAVFTGQLD